MSAAFTPMVVAAARALCKEHAEACNVNADDLWNLDSDDFKRMAALALDAAAAPELLEALRELLHTALTPMPAAEAGTDAQNDWADRRAAARNNASALIAKATGTAS